MSQSRYAILTLLPNPSMDCGGRSRAAPLLPAISTAALLRRLLSHHAFGPRPCPAGLRCIHGSIGLLKRDGYGIRRFCEGRESYARGNREVRSGHSPRYRRCQASAERSTFTILGIRHDDHELVAAKPSYGIRFSGVLTQHFADQLQCLVSRTMPMAIIQLLESIEIKNREREDAAVALLPGDFSPDNGFHAPAIGQARKLVRDRQCLHSCNIRARAARKSNNHRTRCGLDKDIHRN